MVSSDLAPAQMHLVSWKVSPALVGEASAVDRDRKRTRRRLIGVTAGRLAPEEEVQVFVIRTDSKCSPDAVVSMGAKVAVAAMKQP